MNTTPLMDEINKTDMDNPGIQLANIRQQKGYSVEYVAGKLHLRARIIELIEQSAFSLLPEPVFVKGYLRAYSKLLGVSPDPFLAYFDTKYVIEKKPERALWQSKKESHRAEYIVRWFTLLFALGVMLAVGVWWEKNKDSHSHAGYSPHNTTTALSKNTTATNLQLADVAEMQNLLTPHNTSGSVSASMSFLEKSDE